MQVSRSLIAGLMGVAMLVALSGCGGDDSTEERSVPDSNEATVLSETVDLTVIESGRRDSAVENGRPADPDGLNEYLAGKPKLLSANPVYLAKRICEILDAGYGRSQAIDSARTYLMSYYPDLVWQFAQTDQAVLYLVHYTCPEHDSVR